VNRLGTILTTQIKSNTVDAITFDIAIEMLLKENNSHFENLYEKILQHQMTFLAIFLNHNGMTQIVLKGNNEQ